LSSSVADICSSSSSTSLSFIADDYFEKGTYYSELSGYLLISDTEFTDIIEEDLDDLLL
jgi:hypothetical protein